MSPLLISMVMTVVAAQDVRYRIVSELAMQELVTKAVAPEYPKSDQRTDVTGVVVVEIRLNAKHSLESVKALESPSTAMTQTTTNALAQWQFAGTTNSSIDNSPLIGKLTFYFSHCGGRYVAYYSREAPQPICKK